MRTNKITLFALLCAAALVIQYFETMIPVFSVVPGGKLGLANVVTMVVFCTMGVKTALMFGTARCLLTAVLLTGPVACIYSLAGTILSVLSMALAEKLLRTHVSEVGLSIIGAVFFNVGQIVVCSIFLESLLVFRYLPALLAVSSFSGGITGYIAQKIKPYLKGTEF